MTIKRTISLMLAALTFIAMLVSCKGGEETAVVTTAADTTSAIEVETELQPYVDKIDYNGASFFIQAAFSQTYNKLMFADEETGDVFYDELYSRTLMTEEYFNIDMGYNCELQEVELIPAVNASIMAGDNKYQLVLSNNMRGNTALVTQHMILDWNTISTVDFSHVYWNSSVTENLTVSGKNFFAKSSYALPTYSLVAFNKGMAEEYNFGNLYDLVREGGWTLDSMTDMSKVITRDIDGDGDFDINDAYGICIMADHPVNSFRAGCEIPLTKVNDEGMLMPAVNNERMITMLEKIYDIIVTRKLAWTYPWKAVLTEDMYIPMDSGRVLFFFQQLTWMTNLRECETDYGLIPYPKFDEAQETYHIDDYGKLLTVPVTVPDPNMVGNVCEMLGYFSYINVAPAYYESLFNQKVCRDEESIEMLQLCADGLLYDPGMTFFGLDGALQAFMYFPCNMVNQKNNNFSSFYASKEEQAIKQIQDFYIAIEG
ncbi:MAG: hypothetical protein GX628_09475 [Clostridiales bacterium]|nr:hypothetical protein [Clostridiales bacterium]